MKHSLWISLLALLAFGSCRISLVIGNNGGIFKDEMSLSEGLLWFSFFCFAGLTIYMKVAETKLGSMGILLMALGLGVSFFVTWLTPWLL